MNQNVSREEIYKLTDKQFINLLKLLKIKFVNQYEKDENKVRQEYTDAKNNQIQILLWWTLENILSIGNMIEILDNKYEVEVSKDVFTTKECWNVSLFHKEEFIFYKEYIKEELVDALWEAVKEILCI
jgi:hypothetical protein